MSINNLLTFTISAIFLFTSNIALSASKAPPMDSKERRIQERNIRNLEAGVTLFNMNLLEEAKEKLLSINTETYHFAIKDTILGVIYLRGTESTAPNIKKARDYLEDAYKYAGRKDKPFISFLLGNIYYKTPDLKDNKKSAYYFLQSISKKRLESAYHLGLIYSEKETLNYKESLHYFKIAAEMGDKKAKKNLAMMYYFGYGTSINTEKAQQILSTI